MASQEDAELILAYRGGDKRAGATLTRRYYTKVLGFCRSKAPSAAKDITHDSFAACFQGLDTLREPAAFRSFLFGIVCNRIRMHYRRRRIDGERLDFGTVTSMDLDPSPSQIMVQHDEQRLLLEALRRMPLDMQILLELYYWQNLGVGDIASALAIPPNTVKARLFRGRKQLKELLLTLEAPGEVVKRTVTDLESWARGLREAAV